MKSRITPYFRNLVWDAALKSFWRKKSLRKFLGDSGVSESFLATWASDESKRDFLDRLFGRLLKAAKGEESLVRIAKNIAEQQSFPDLMNWEDTPQKMKAAHDAVQRLRLYIEKQDETIESTTYAEKTREEFYRRQQEISKSKQSLEDLSYRLATLSKRLGAQDAGYEFQNWFYDLLDFCELQSRRPYVHNGRQVDGSITLSGTTYLVELKFTAEQAGAQDIDIFYRKVTSKADNTMGIMISISGFSSVAKAAASGERTPLLLMDYSHLYLVLGNVMSIEEVIERLRRYASQTGEAFLTAGDFSR